MVNTKIDIFAFVNKVNLVSGEVLASNVKVKLRQIIAYEVVDSVDVLTTTARVTIPARISLFKQGSLYLKKDRTSDVYYEIKTGMDNQLAIYSGYNFREYNIFRGYITEIVSNEEEVVLLCEDEMYALKNTKAFKESFPSPLKNAVVDAAFDGQSFRLDHLLYYIFKDIQPSYQVFCNKVNLGKVKLNDFFNAAEILDILKERYGIYAYFKTFMDSSQRISLPIDGRIKGTPRLYVGYKYWQSRVAVDVNELIKSKANSSDTQIDYSFFHQFMYPYRVEFDGQYNRVLDWDIEWVKTDKDKLIVEVTSPQDTDQPLVYVYPEDATTQKLEKFKESMPDLSTVESFEEYSARKKQELNDQEYVQFKNDKPNQIKLNIPNLDIDSMKELAKNAYNNYLQSGYTGEFLTFGGLPLSSLVQKGDVVRLRFNDLKNSGKIEDYSYFVSKVVYEYSEGRGLTQKVSIDTRYYEPALIVEAEKTLGL